MRTEPQLLDRSCQLDEKTWWDLWNSSYRSEDNRDEISAELFAHVAALSQQVTRGRMGRVLEIACGTGTLSRQLRFSSYHGLDMSPAAIEIACQKAESMELPAGVNRPTYEAADFHVLSTINPLVYNRIRRTPTVRLENGPVSHWLSRRELHQLVKRAGLTIVRSYTIMPRGNMGFLRVINSPRLNRALGKRGAAIFRRLKERAGCGQYRVVVAQKLA
jgi:SAM-dependent methyltransferase